MKGLRAPLSSIFLVPADLPLKAEIVLFRLIAADPVFLIATSFFKWQVPIYTNPVLYRAWVLESTGTSSLI